MGEEIRRVPSWWEHPEIAQRKYWESDLHRGNKYYQPLHDESYEDARQKWLDGLESRMYGPHPDYEVGQDYWKCNGGPPDREYYRPAWKDGEATYYQIYETVSEGTPVSPVFGTEDEMIKWLVE